MADKQMDYDDCYKFAFGLAVREIDGADNVSMTSLYDALSNYSGDSRRQSKALIECLGSSGWKWVPFENQLAKESDYLKMAKEMASSIERLAHGLHRREQLMAVAERRPYWKFRVGIGADAPQRCLDNDGAIKHYQDPFWKENMPPCGLPYCCCQVTSLSERDMKRRKQQ